MALAAIDSQITVAQGFSLTWSSAGRSQLRLTSNRVAAGLGKVGSLVSAVPAGEWRRSQDGFCSCFWVVVRERRPGRLPADETCRSL